MSWKLPLIQVPELPKELGQLQHFLVQLRSLLLLLHEKGVDLGSGLTRSDAGILSVLPSGVDHGGLAGLADDDHTQYARHAIGAAKGSILVWNGGTERFEELKVGADGTILTANSAETLGMGWV